MKKLIIAFLFLLMFANVIFDKPYDPYVLVKKWATYWKAHYHLKIQQTKLVEIIKHLIDVESCWKSNSCDWSARTKSYTYGLMRLKASTAKDMGWKSNNVEELFDENTNLKFGIRYLCWDIKRYHGDIRKALAAYNAGHCSYDKNGWFLNQAYVNQILCDIDLFSEKYQIFDPLFH